MTANSAVDNLVSDEVIKRRLLIDGDGAGDDRKILGVIKSFLSWCTNEEQDEESHVSYKRLVNQIHQIEHCNTKTHYAIQVNQQAKEDYLSLDEQVKQEIEKAKDQIEDSKKLLLKAKERRKNRTEYNALARIIKTKPDRTETEGKRSTLEDDYESLKNERKALEDRLDQRKRNMQELVSAIHRLQDLLDAEDHQQVPVYHPVPMDVDEPPESSSVVNNFEPMSICTENESGEGNSSRDSVVAVSSVSDVGEMSVPPVAVSNPGSPLEQLAQHSVDDGSLPDNAESNPIDAEKSEKYDDLSESDNESGEDS